VAKYERKTPCGKCSCICGVNWRDLCEMILFWSEVKWSEASYGKILGEKIPCTLEWPFTEGIWLYCDYFILVCILYCGCCNLLCNVWVCVCVDFCNVWLCVCVVLCVCRFFWQFCGCFCNMCTCIDCVMYCRYCVFTVSFVYIYSYLFCCTSVRTTATEWKLNYSK
jgi:hypothetical protein